MSYFNSITSTIASCTFHNAATTAANGTEFTVASYKTLLVEIYWSVGNTARTVTFYAKSASGTLRPLIGIKEGDTSFTMALSTTGAGSTTGECWEFEISCYESIIMDLTSITGGTVSVKGKVMA